MGAEGIRFELDKIRIEGDPQSGKVRMIFGNVDVTLFPEDARRIAFALMGQADRAENRPPQPTPTG
jgi:hypothetical protein